MTSRVAMYCFVHFSRRFGQHHKAFVVHEGSVNNILLFKVLVRGGGPEDAIGGDAQSQTAICLPPCFSPRSRVLASILQ